MLVTFTGVSKSFGTELLFEQVNLVVNEGDKIGFIGANGAGKTTLLNVLTGALSVDEGTISKKSGLSIGYLKQNSGLKGSNTIVQEMRSVFEEAIHAQKRMEALSHQIAEHPEDAKLAAEYAAAMALFEASDGYQMEVNINKVLRGMGFADKDDNMPVGNMSGGEKTRLALARLLLMKPDLLILDEPTNHLDFKTLAWLENYLADYKGAMLVVSHDRYFLDKVANKIWEMADYTVEEYRGNYSSYKIQKEEKVAYLLKEYSKQQNQIESMEDYVRRNIARASTSQMAKSRRKQLEKIEVIKKPRMQEKAPSFSFEVERQPVNDVLAVHDLLLVVGEQKTVLADELSFELKRGERMAVIGANGTGKSTLLKTLLQQPLAAQGEVIWGKNTDVGYYDQENKDMKPGLSAMDELWRRFPALPENSVRSLLGRVLLTGDDAFKKVEMLSGGERAKLGFAILMAGKSNVLVLDEPTNHLDLPAREKLEQALLDYKGTLLFVSHDRYFVNALAGRILEIDQKEWHSYNGSFDDYMAKKAVPAPQGEQAEEKQPVAKQQNAKEVRRQQAQKRQKIYELEQRMAALEQEEKELEELIAQNPADFELLSEKCARLEDVKAEHEACMAEWVELV